MSFNDVHFDVVILNTCPTKFIYSCMICFKRNGRLGLGIAMTKNLSRVSTFCTWSVKLSSLMVTFLSTYLLRGLFWGAQHLVVTFLVDEYSISNRSNVVSLVLICRKNHQYWLKTKQLHEGWLLGSTTITPRTITPRTITPGQLPPGQLPP